MKILTDVNKAKEVVRDTDNFQKRIKKFKCLEEQEERQRVIAWPEERKKYYRLKEYCELRKRESEKVTVLL